MRPNGGGQPPRLRPRDRSICASDDALAAALARDLGAGFEALAYCWQDRIYAFALRMTGSPSDAEDLAQETLVRAWSALGDYAPDRVRALQIRSWLFQIAVNLGRNRARAMSRSVSVSLEAMEDHASPDERAYRELNLARLADGDPAGNPEEALERRQRLAELAARLLALPEPHRLALTLRHIEGLTYPEIALATGLPAGTVKSHASRGAAELRRAIEREQAREAYRVETEMK